MKVSGTKTLTSVMERVTRSGPMVPSMRVTGEMTRLTAAVV